MLVSGSMGDHGLTVLARRNSLDLDPALKSDSAALNYMVEALIAEVGEIHVLRDPTRGGLASTLNEIAAQSGVDLEIEEAGIPVLESVRAGCSVLGLDPLYLANEGKLICMLPWEKREEALTVMARFEEGRLAAVIGRVLGRDASGGEKNRAGRVVLRTLLGGKRLLSMLEGEQLPRIC